MTSEAPSTDLTTEQSTSEGPANSTETEGSTTNYSDAGTISIESSTLDSSTRGSTPESTVTTAASTSTDATTDSSSRTTTSSTSLPTHTTGSTITHYTTSSAGSSSGSNSSTAGPNTTAESITKLPISSSTAGTSSSGSSSSGSSASTGYRLIIVWNVFNWFIVYWNYERRFIKRKHWLIDRFNRIDRLLSGLDWHINWFDRDNLLRDYHKLNPIDFHSLAEDHNHNDKDHRNYGNHIGHLDKLDRNNGMDETGIGCDGADDQSERNHDPYPCATACPRNFTLFNDTYVFYLNYYAVIKFACSCSPPPTTRTPQPRPAVLAAQGFSELFFVNPRGNKLFNTQIMLIAGYDKNQFLVDLDGKRRFWLGPSFRFVWPWMIGFTIGITVVFIDWNAVYRNCPFVAAAPMAFFVYYMALSYATQYDDMLASIISFAASMVYSAITGGQAVFTRSPTRAKFRPDQAVKAAKKAAKERADREQAELEAIEAYNDDLKARFPDIPAELLRNAPQPGPKERKLFWRLMERWTFKQVHRRDQMSALWDKFVREVVNFDSVDVKEMEDRLDLAPFTSLVAWLTYVPPRHQRVTAVHREELVRDNGQFGGRRFDRPEEILLDEQIDKFWGGVEEYEEERQQQWLPVYDDDAAFTRWLGTEHEEAARFKPKEACPDPELPNRSINPRNRPVDIYWLNDARPGFIGPKRQQMVELGPWDGFVRKALHTQNAVDLEWEPVWAQHVFERDREANGPHPYDSFVLGQDWFWNEPQCMQTGNMYMGI
ncbi:unnamed protein product, partial [Mesorhabditis spiculigera]